MELSDYQKKKKSNFSWLYRKLQFQAVSWIVKKRVEFGYKLLCSHFATIHYMTTHKTIYMYYLNKSYDTLNMSCDWKHT